MPRWWTEDKVAEALGISLYQARQRMKPDYQGRYVRIKSREFAFNGKPIRKAYYKTIEALREKDTVPSGAQDNVQVSV